MAIDPRIPLGVTMPDFAGDAMKIMSMGQQMRAQQDAAQLNALQLQAARGDLADKNALRAAYSIADPTARRNALMQNPLGAATVIKMDKDLATQRAQEIKFEVDKRKVQRDDLVVMGQTPEGFEAWKRKHGLEQELANVPYSQETVVRLAMTPDSLIESSVISAYQQAQLDQGNERIGVSRDTLAEKQRHNREMELKPAAGSTKLVTDDRGNVTVFDAQGNPLATHKGVGKKSAGVLKGEADSKRVSNDIDMALAQLKEVVKPGGLIEQATGSGAGALVDTAAAFVGTATPGAIATGKLQPIADLVLKQVPRFEGPQSDKDTQSYREAAGQLANNRLPNKIRVEAAKTIIRIMEERKGQFEGIAPTGAAGADRDAGTAPPAPEGVDSTVWQYMTPEERALWSQ